MKSSWIWFYALFYSSLLLGWLLRAWQQQASKIMRFTVLCIDAPLFLYSFWALSLSQARHYILVPIFAALLVLLPLALTPFWARCLFKAKASQGSFILSSAFSNIGTTGGAFIGYLLYGLPGLALGYLFLLPYPFIIFTLGFSTARAYAGKSNTNLRDVLAPLLTDPLSLVPLAAISLGLGLNLAGLKPWSGISMGVDWFIKIGLGLQCLAIGMTLKPTHFFSPWKPVLSLSAIKFLFLPLAAMAMVWLGYGSLDPLPAKIILIQSAMPPAIYSVITANLFQLDRELANSLWISATLFLIPVAGILFWLLG